MPSPETLPPAERLEARLNLRSQYDSLVRILNQSGVLDILPAHGELGIVGLDSEHPETETEYPIPSLEAVSSWLKEQSPELEPKVDQGFTKLLLVPAAMPLDRLRQRYAEQLKLYHSHGTLLDSQGKSVDLDTATPLWAWDKYNNANRTGNMVYYPEKFEKDNHGGITKQQLIQKTLKTPFPGWEVRLIEDLPNLPAQGQGQPIGGRKQVEANATPGEYLKQPQTEQQYKQEKGFTPEQWLTYALTNRTTIQQKGKTVEALQVTDDYQGKGKIAYLTGAWFPASGIVPYAWWYRGHRQVYLNGNVPGRRDADCSVRRSVGV